MHTKRNPWRSLKTRILLLAVFTCCFLLVAAGGLFSFIRKGHAKTIQSAERHLTQVSSGFARTFTAQSAYGLSLRNLPAGSRMHASFGPPPAPEDGMGAPPPPPPLRAADPLSSLTATVLQKETGIEGGLMASDGSLVGYAFPSHEGPGPQKEMPQRERPTIAQLAHEAESTGKAQRFTFEGPHDVILFCATPVYESVAGKQQITGAVWLMQRLPDINRDRSTQVLLATLGFGVAATLTALLAWFFTVEVSGDVAKVTRRLALLEQDLSQARDEQHGAQLAEFDDVLAGIDNLALTLQERIANERRLEDELRHKERLSSLGQFAAGVAHELRNPLATIRLRAQMSQHTLSEGAVSRNGNIILEEVDRLDAMIGRLLYFARPIQLDLQVLDVAELCRSVVSSWVPRLPAGIALETTGGEGVLLMADRSRLIQVLDNLVENAVQASHAPGEVRLTVTETEGAVRIDVLDRGVGFAAGALKQAFDPFYTTREAGTGLGLSIAFELVAAHGGELAASARQGGGAVVSVVLSRARSEEGRIA